jgi:tetratricopeptide (TPR) repeat protein
MDAFLEFATGMKLLITDFLHQSMVASNVMIVLLLGIAISAYIAVLIITFSYAKTIWLSVIITFSPLFRVTHLRILMFACLVSFVLLLSSRSVIGILTWAVALGSALSWRFASGSERRAIVGFAAFLICFGLIADCASRVISTQHPSSPLKMAALAGHVPESRLETVESKTKSTSRYDPIDEFMQGLFYLRSGDYLLAIEHLNVASKFAPDNAAILNNLGVALHNLGKFREAKAVFEEALKCGPREAPIHYNYSQTLNALLYYDLAQEELSKASTLDFELTRSLVTARDTSPLIPMNLQTRVLWQLAMHSDNRMLKIGYHPLETGPFGLILLIILAGLMITFNKRSKVPARCDICCGLVQAQVTKRKRKEVLCRGCSAVKRASANDNDRIERRLEEHLRRLDKRRCVLRVITGLVLPGGSYHIAGQRLKGFLISVAITCLFILAATEGWPIKVVPQLRGNPPAGWPVPTFIVVYLIYAWRSTVLAISNAGED